MRRGRRRSISWLAGAALASALCACEPPADTISAAECVGGKCDSPSDPGSGLDWDEIRLRCTPPAPDEPVLFMNDFRWGYTLAEMAQRFEDVYVSPKRLSGRAYYDADSDRFVLPFDERFGGDVALSTRLVESVKHHIERSLALGYAYHVFFPDLGHSHFFIPQERWDQVYATLPVSARAQLYTALLDDPETLILYHTAEQLLMLGPDRQPLPDREIQWRFYTRNVVGENRGVASRLELLHDLTAQANTVKEYPGHRYYGAGFNVSANRSGCFPYEHNGQRRYFDLSLFDLPYDPNAGGL